MFVQVSIGLVRCSLGPEGASTIASMAANMPSLTECNVRDNNLDDESAAMLAKVGTERRIMLFGLKHGQTTASFQGERLGPLDGILLASDLAVSDSLTECNLNNNRLGAVGWAAIFTALRDSKVSKISTWDLSGQMGIKESLEPLLEYIAVSESLSSINLRYVSLGKGVEDLKAAVRGRTNFELILR